MEGHTLLVPFLNHDPVYAQGVEFGMQVMALMNRGKRVVRGYFLSENEEQIRVAGCRMGYTLTKCKPWKFEGKETGWVWMVLRKEPKEVEV